MQQHRVPGGCIAHLCTMNANHRVIDAAMTSIQPGDPCVLIDVHYDNGLYAAYVKSKHADGTLVVHALGYSNTDKAQLKHIVCKYDYNIDNLSLHTGSNSAADFEKWKRSFLDRAQTFYSGSSSASIASNNVSNGPPEPVIQVGNLILKQMFEKKTCADVMIKCKNGELTAHKCVLSIVCPTIVNEHQNTIQMDTDINKMRLMLECIYTGIANVDQMKKMQYRIQDLFDLITLADTLKLDSTHVYDLVKYAITLPVTNSAEFNDIRKFGSLLKTGNRNKEFSVIEQHVKTLVQRNFNLLYS